MVQSRVSASLLHLAFSGALIAALCGVVFFLWYPGAYYALSGASRPLHALVLVDLVIGPVLTLIVYKVGKPGLKFDLIAIAVMQVSAFAYGAWTLAQQRPAFLVYEVGLFHVVSEAEIADRKVPEQLKGVDAQSGVTEVWARPFEDPEAILGVLLNGNPEAYKLPEQYLPLNAGGRELAGFGEPLTEQYLSVNTALAAVLASDLRAMEMARRGESDFRLYPVLARMSEGSVLVDVANASVVGVYPVTVDFARFPKKSARKTEPAKSAGSD